MPLLRVVILVMLIKCFSLKFAMPQKCFLTGQPSDLMRKSLAIHIEKKSFRQIYQLQRSARAAAEASKGQSNSIESQVQSSLLSIANYVDPIAKKMGGRNKKNKKDMKKVSQLSPQEVERRALEELEILRLKKRAIFTKIRERKERKIKEAASSNQL